MLKRGEKGSLQSSYTPVIARYKIAADQEQYILQCVVNLLSGERGISFSVCSVFHTLHNNILHISQMFKFVALFTYYIRNIRLFMSPYNFFYSRRR